MWEAEEIITVTRKKQIKVMVIAWGKSHHLISNMSKMQAVWIILVEDIPLCLKYVKK